MTSEAEKLALEALQRLGSTLERVERKVDEVTVRMADIEGGYEAILAGSAYLVRMRQARQRAIDDIDSTLGRIERRLGLVN